MTILAFDASTLACSACVLKDGKVLSSRYLNTGLTHSQTLLPMIEAVLQDAHLTVDSIDRIGVTVGPGSFTGVKIAVATAKGLAHKNNTPIGAISSLEALAWGLRYDGIVCAVEDARRSMLYNANFDHGVRICEDRQISIEDLLNETDKPLLLCGDGAKLVEETAKKSGKDVQLSTADRMFIRAEIVAQMVEILPEEAFVSPAKLTPSYLRLPQAERERNERENN